MGFVKTTDEIARLQATIAAPKALSGEMISIQFRTDPAIVRRVLPPGLDPAPEPTGVAYLGRWGRSNAGPFDGAALYLRAEHEGVPGDYCLAMPMSTEQAILFGREMLGEAKKLARVTLERAADRVRGTVDRHGETILEIEANVAQELPARPFQSTAYHYKYSHRADGRGLDFDPLLVRVDVEHEVNRLVAGVGSLTLRSTDHDPLGEIEIVESTGAIWAQGDLRARARVLGSVSAKDFLPYAFSKGEDWTALDDE